MNKHQQSVYGLQSLIYLLLGVTPNIPQYTTVNERLSILGDARPNRGDKYSMNVLIAGNKGHTTQPGTDGIPLMGVNDHVATNASLYGPLPLAMRTVDDDLSPAMRQRYCLRKLTTVNGINYFAYYGLRIDLNEDNTNVDLLRVTKTEQGDEISAFTPNNENLFPVPMDLPTSGAITTSNTHVRVSAIVNVKLNQQEIDEFVNAVKIMYNGDERYAVMSEFGLCCGVNRIVEVEGQDGIINFNESIGTQVYAFTMEHKALFYNTQELSIDFDVGNQIPLLAAQSIPTIQTVP